MVQKREHAAYRKREKKGKAGIERLEVKKNKNKNKNKKQQSPGKMVIILAIRSTGMASAASEIFRNNEGKMEGCPIDDK